MSDNRPIGVFDSGLGGLTVVKEIHNTLPHESTIYIGDTARVPYGNRSPETITQFATQSVEALLKFDVKAIVIACGTVSSVSHEYLKKTYTKIPILDVIEPTASSAVYASRNRCIGVIGTHATIRSQSFEKALKQLDPNVTVFSQSCPLFVPIIEEGIVEQHPILTETIKLYLTNLQHSSIDTLILGCTHYPLIHKSLAQFLPNITLINAGVSVASSLKQILTKNQIESSDSTNRTHKYLITDKNDNFERIAKLFLNAHIEVNKITL